MNQKEVHHREIILVQPTKALLDAVHEADLDVHPAKSVQAAYDAMQERERYVLAYGDAVLGPAATGQVKPLETDQPCVTVLVSMPENELEAGVAKQAAVYLEAVPLLEIANPAALMVLRLLQDGHDWPHINAAIDAWQEASSDGQ